MPYHTQPCYLSLAKSSAGKIMHYKYLKICNKTMAMLRILLVITLSLSVGHGRGLDPQVH